MTVAGIHLMPHLSALGGPRPSAVAVLDPAAALVHLRLADPDEEVAALVPAGTFIACVDAPLAVPDSGGRRDLERVLAWCDVPAFPVSSARMRKVYGGARGVALAPRLAHRAARVLETIPDLVLRELMWERAHPPDAPPLELADYRARWLSVRPPAYRGRAGGRAGVPGLLRAHALVAEVLELGGWAPDPDAVDWGAIADAARLDALLCAYAALRLRRGSAVVLGTPARGATVVPADANLRARLEVNLARMRAEGAVRI